MTGDPSVTPVFPEDFPRVLPLLRLLEPGRSPESWRSIFDYGWRRPDEPVGYGLRKGDRFLGYLGMIRSRVEVDGRMEELCNLTSWIVSHDAGGAGALLVLPLKRLKGVTITSLTSNTRAGRVFDRLGFQELDPSWTTLRPTLSLVRPRRPDRCRVTCDPSEIGSLVGAEEARILEDHLPYARPVLTQDGDGTCFSLYNIRRRRRLPAIQFHYVSDPEAFTGHWPDLQKWLFLRHGALLSQADSRLLPGPGLPRARVRRFQGPRLYRSSTLRPDQIPEIYSERVLLGL